MSAENTESTAAADAMADEWASALAEAKAGTASEVHDAAEQVAPAAFTNFAPTTASSAGNDINMILDIPVQLTVELGRMRSLGVTMSVNRMPNFSFTTTTSPCAIR